MHARPRAWNRLLRHRAQTRRETPRPSPQWNDELELSLHSRLPFLSLPFCWVASLFFLLDAGPPSYAVCHFILEISMPSLAISYNGESSLNLLTTWIIFSMT